MAEEPCWRVGQPATYAPEGPLRSAKLRNSVTVRGLVAKTAPVAGETKRAVQVVDNATKTRVWRSPLILLLPFFFKPNDD